MEKRITVDQALEMTMNILNGISVPVSMMEQIGIPISRAVHNIEQCVEALNRADAEREKTEDEPEFVDAGNAATRGDLPDADEKIEVTEDGNNYAE